ncbi:MAG: hypothetical protein ACJASF_001263 [Vicingaceae bacterium]|jgi:hypothetical protein
MKKTLLSIFGLSILAVVVQITLTSYSGGPAFSQNSGNTGAPGETTTCRSCHGTGFSTTVSMVIKDVQGNPVTSYIPGTVYDAEFTVNAIGANRYGFQMVSLNSSNGPVNGFSTPAANTRLVPLGNGRQYAEHAGKSISNVFSTQWTAPGAGTGTVTFYGGGAAVNNNSNNGGDGGNTTTLNLTENVSVGYAEATLRNELLVYPNPTRNIIKLKNTASDVKNTLAELFTVSGQLVLSERLNLQENSEETLNVSKFENGYYILRISNNGQIVEKKILIQN